MKTAVKTWVHTKHQNLYRHKSGVYYARLSAGGKKTWRSLETKVLGVAKAQLEELKTAAAARAENAAEPQGGERMTVEDAIAIRQRQIQNDPSIKDSTRHYWNQIFTSLRREWPELPAMEIRKVTPEQCQKWAGKTARTASGTRFNNTLALLKQLFAIGVERHARHTNPAAAIKRVKVRSKDLSSRLPTQAKFSAWVSAIREGHGRFSRSCADFVEFLAYTGLRKGEVEWVKWRDCDFTGGEILVRGDPEAGTKNSEVRRVPMIPACRKLLLRLKEANPEAKPQDSVLKVQEAQNAMDRAAEEVGMERITHHDLRHLFATVCIEQGVDIPTVSKWLGHRDGGALAMKVYGHLRNEHSQAAAARVLFSA